MGELTRAAAKARILETCGEGWLNYVDMLFDACPEEVKITEIFQKWGALKCRYEGEDEDFELFVEAIHTVSARTCEMCGKNGREAIINGWETAICDAHYEAAKGPKFRG